MKNNIAPEFSSVESFVQFCMDDEKTDFSPGDAQKIAKALKMGNHQPIIEELKSFGLKLAVKEATREVRGFSSNPNGTFPFSGANSTFSTPGGDSILGFVGRKG